MENPAKAFEEARKTLIDLVLVDSNLALPYEERVMRHEGAMELVVALREARAAPFCPGGVRDVGIRNASAFAA